MGREAGVIPGDAALEREVRPCCLGERVGRFLKPTGLQAGETEVVLDRGDRRVEFDRAPERCDRLAC
ncbi:MAG: hypothetical protein M0002_18510 [Rhodospirillales bacterium]|nr:hypothetical protein [Rhodospirillales bacterium]